MQDNLSKPAIGVIFHPKFPPETLADYARKAESAGFDELWLWDDCFLPGAFTSAAIALSATQKIKVGIGLIPVKAYNPVFAAMELTTLARAFPHRILPGFGYGVGTWMTQIGASPKPTIKGLEDTVTAVRSLLNGELVTTHTENVNLEKVQMQLTPEVIPPLFLGAVREKTLQLSGRIGDGTILAEISSPEYVRWAREQIQVGMLESGRTQHRLVVYIFVKVSQDGKTARAAMRQVLASRLPWSDAQVNALGIGEQVETFTQEYGKSGDAQPMPDAWVDAFSAAGTPQQVAESIQRLISAGADSVVFVPLNGDPDCLDEYIRYLMPWG